MNKFSTWRTGAILIYSTLTIFPTAAIAILLLMPPGSFPLEAMRFLTTYAISLLSILLILAAGSALEVIFLVTRFGQQSSSLKVLIAISLIMIAVAFCWGVIAGLLYAVGCLYLVATYRDIKAKAA